MLMNTPLLAKVSIRSVLGKMGHIISSLVSLKRFLSPKLVFFQNRFG
jgi:hypothetical protein